MYDDQAIKPIEPLVGVFFAYWSIQLAAAITTEDRVRRLQQAGDYAALFDKLMMLLADGDFGEELNEAIEDFLFIRQPSSSTFGGPSEAPRWDEPILKMLRTFQAQYCD
jgi:hypothetical protein